MANINQENLQRLVDGELDLDQTRQVLVEAENNPSNWREIACAMVENQIFRKQFLASGGSGSLAQDTVATNQPVDEIQIKSVDSLPVKRFAIPFQNLALAAGLLIALTTGYLVGSSHLPSFDPSGTMAETPVEKQSSDGLVNGLADPSPRVAANDDGSSDQISPASFVQFETPDGRAPKGQVPLFLPEDFQVLIGKDRANKFDPQTLRQLLPELGITDELKAQLGRSGYQVDVHVDYVSGNFSDGRKFVVPMRTVRWSPGN
jgi:hypothetical protein